MKFHKISQLSRRGVMGGMWRRNELRLNRMC